MKYCVDCKHFKSDKSFYLFLMLIPFCYKSVKKSALRFGRCKKYALENDENSISPLFNKISNGPAFIYRKGYTDFCGLEAKYFEPKEG